MTGPSPQHGAPAAGPQAGSQAGWQGSACRRQGERNSMNDGRRQPANAPLQPGAATRLPRTIARHNERDMMGLSTAGGPNDPHVDELKRRP